MRAGSEFVLEGKIKAETLKIIEQPFSTDSLEDIMARGNKKWERLIRAVPKTI
jgi:hypothetical protein